MRHNLKTRFSKVKLLVSDFDGVMTDGTVYLDENGKEMVRCSRKDGLGIELLKKNDIEVVVLSKEKNSVVQARCTKLRIECWQGLDSSLDKLGILKKILQERGIKKGEVCYIGDDINDIEVLKFVGIAVTVADGHSLVKKQVDFMTKANGGHHAIRELAELILDSKRIEIKV